MFVQRPLDRRSGGHRVAAGELQEREPRHRVMAISVGLSVVALRPVEFPDQPV